jgi:hypothetical protein
MAGRSEEWHVRAKVLFIKAGSGNQKKLKKFALFQLLLTYIQRNLSILG